MTGQPDFERFRKVVLRQGEPDRVPFVELFHDHEIMEAILGETVPFPRAGEPETVKRYHKARLKFWLELGYDYISVSPGFHFPRKEILSEDFGALKRSVRSWVDESHGIIENWEEFDRYPWPRPEDVDYSAFEIVAKLLPDGMKIVATTSGVLEWAMWLMGYAPFAYTLHDDPALVQALFDRIGGLFVAIYRSLAPMDAVGALWLGDDMGHKHSTLISAKHLRHYAFPWQQRLAQIAHTAGKPFLLHSCGLLDEVMEDLIEHVGIDAKHSFEDVIVPVWEFKQRFGNRIAVLGGVDMNLLTSGTEDEVRVYVRRVLERCAPGGGYALGSGNSVANYVPVRNFLAMLGEGNRFNGKCER